MSSNERDLSQLLRSADRPRALTDAERHRLLERLAVTNAPVPTRGPEAILELQPTDPTPRVSRRFGSSLMLAGSCAAAIAVVLVVVVISVREPIEREPVRPVTEVANPTLPSPDDVTSAFCVEHVDAIADALERWRGIENWVWARGTPDLGQMVDEALESATGLDNMLLSARAATALDRLRSDLPDVDASAFSDRDSVAPTIAAIDAALDTLTSIAGDLTPPCDLEQLTAARRDG